MLDKILAAKRDELAALANVPSRPRASGGPRGATVIANLVRPGGSALRLVTEIKRRSPSAGPLSTVLSVADRALAYARAGATMMSVLCDTTFFDGGYHHLVEARAALDQAGLAVPLLAKEFILDERQLDEAAACGADAALLIVRIVDRGRLTSLVSHARSLGLEPLVEVVTEEELDAAVGAGAQVIGVNARDLDTLEMDSERAARVLAAIDDDRVAVHLSGLKGPEDVASVARTRVDAALIGEALMRRDDPTPLLREMLAAAQG
ncbi:MAG TPA: indole-3-glycerol phosphate synthase TrpC [Labilithrix sp.]|nr:indole-3-glycerol phosphate synthase TrpC [Labilithrix sp.]